MCVRKVLKRGDKGGGANEDASQVESTNIEKLQVNEQSSSAAGQRERAPDEVQLDEVHLDGVGVSSQDQFMCELKIQSDEVQNISKALETISAQQLALSTQLADQEGQRTDKH